MQDYKFTHLSKGERLARIREGGRFNSTREINRAIYREEQRRITESLEQCAKEGKTSEEVRSWEHKVRTAYTNNNGIGSEITPEERTYYESFGNASIPVLYSGTGAAALGGAGNDFISAILAKREAGKAEAVDLNAPKGE